MRAEKRRAFVFVFVLASALVLCHARPAQPSQQQPATADGDDSRCALRAASRVPSRPSVTTKLPSAAASSDRKQTHRWLPLSGTRSACASERAGGRNHHHRASSSRSPVEESRKARRVAEYIKCRSITTRGQRNQQHRRRPPDRRTQPADRARAKRLSGQTGATSCARRLESSGASGHLKVVAACWLWSVSQARYQSTGRP